jgi:general secretion pathway protein D
MKHRSLGPITSQICSKISFRNRVKNSVKIRVRGSQGSPQGAGLQRWPAKTPGSSMNRRVVLPAASGAIFLKSAFSFALFAVLAGFGLHSVSLHAESANHMFKVGENAEAREDYDTAFDNYQKAYAKAPNDLRFRAAYYRVRVSAASLHMTKGRKLLKSGDEQGALAEFLHAAEIDPGNETAQQEISRMRTAHGEAPLTETSLPQAPGKQAEIDSMSGPVSLRPISNEPLTLHMSEDAKVIYQAVGRAAGVNILFDPDYTSKRVQVDLNAVSLTDALRIVGTMSNTFWRPVTNNTIFVAQNTRAKRTELDEQAVQTFYLTNAWQQNDLNDVQTALRNVLPNAKVYGVASQNAIVMRATPDELLLAQKLINDLDKARPEVVVDIAVLEVSKNWERNLGLAWPSSIGVALQPNTTTSSSTSTSTTTTGTTTGTTTTPTLYDLAHLKATNFAVTIGGATANLLLSDSNTKILQNPRIRATDSQKATMKIGSRIPIATGSYQTGAATAMVSSLVNTQFQYLDVGVNIEMTPTVHFDHDVTLKVKIEVTSQSGNVTISGVTEPIISQRVVDQIIRLREGEANILGGIQDKQDQQSWSGIPGLGSIPILKYIFGSKDHTIHDDEIVFVVVPHIVRAQELGPINLRTIDTGVGQAIELRRIQAEPAAQAPASAPASTPNPQPGSNPPPTPMPPPPAAALPTSPAVGTVPGQSAEAAAPAALAQMRAAADSSTDAAAKPILPSLPAKPPGTGNVAFSMVSPPSIAADSTFKVPVMLSGGVDIASVPLQIQYDPATMSLVNIDAGDFLGRDGQAVALVHRDDGPGTITVNASRPPGTPGVSGSGVVCVLSFQAKAAGNSTIAITRPAAINSAQQQVSAQGAQATIQVK